MSAMLVKFQSMYRVSVAPALAQRWDYDVRDNGEKNIKLQIAQEKRSATTLHQASLQFCNIRPAQEQAIKAAALQFEADLIQELSSADARLAFAPWRHAQGRHTDVALQNISSCVRACSAWSDLRLIPPLRRRPKSGRSVGKIMDHLGMT